MPVCVCRATTSAPGTTAPCGSRTRPLTLAEFRVSCANAGAAGSKSKANTQHTHANAHRMGIPQPKTENAKRRIAVVQAFRPAGQRVYARGGGPSGGAKTLVNLVIA